MKEPLSPVDLDIMTAEQTILDAQKQGAFERAFFDMLQLGADTVAGASDLHGNLQTAQQILNGNGSGAEWQPSQDDLRVTPPDPTMTGPN